MSLSKKRTALFANLSQNFENIASNQLSIPVLVGKAFKKKIGNGPKKGNDYWLINMTSLNKTATYVIPKGDDGNTIKRVKTENESPHKGVAVEPNARLLATCWDFEMADKLTEGKIQHVKLSSKEYNDRITFTLEKITESVPSLLTPESYNKYIVGTPLALLPTIHNMSEADFAPGLEKKLMSRNFVVPLSNDTTQFKDVFVDWDDSDAMVYTAVHSKTDGSTGPGLSEDRGDKRSSLFRVGHMYTNEQKVKSQLYCYANNWKCFGVHSVPLWEKVAKRLIYFAQDWFVHGFTSLDSLESIKGSRDQMEYGEEDTFDEHYSGGFITEMKVNMAKTCQQAGLELTTEYVKEYFKTAFESPEDSVKEHALNDSFRQKVRSNSSFCLNLNELCDTDVDKFFDAVEKSPKTRYFGVFPVVPDGTPDEVYEHICKDPVERVTYLKEHNQHVPAVIFAVNE